MQSSNRVGIHHRASCQCRSRGNPETHGRRRRRTNFGARPETSQPVEPRGRIAGETWRSANRRRKRSEGSGQLEDSPQAQPEGAGIEVTRGCTGRHSPGREFGATWRPAAMNAEGRERRGNSNLSCRQQPMRMLEAGKPATPSKGWRTMMVQFSAKTSGRRQRRKSLAFSLWCLPLNFAA